MNQVLPKSQGIHNLKTHATRSSSIFSSAPFFPVQRSLSFPYLSFDTEENKQIRTFHFCNLSLFAFFYSKTIDAIAIMNRILQALLSIWFWFSFAISQFVEQPPHVQLFQRLVKSLPNIFDSDPNNRPANIKLDFSASIRQSDTT